MKGEDIEVFPFLLLLLLLTNSLAYLILLVHPKEGEKIMAQKMLTKEIEKKLPKLYDTENVPESDKVLVVKYFCPWNSWTWYGVEYNPDERLFFGYVEGFEKEWGYFSLDELEEVRGPGGLKIERDYYFNPKKFSQIKG